MATPSSPQNDAASPSKKPQPIPWTHQETVHLIRAYQEKWYSLKRGPLRQNQWEEVAVVVAARCGYDLNHPSKSALQCRHKMEKLRQRHRADKKHRLTTPTAPASAWQYSSLMDELERGPLPISALAPSRNDSDDDFDDNDTNPHENDERERESYIKSKSINHIVSHSQRPMRTKERLVYYDDIGDDDEDDDDDDDDEDDEYDDGGDDGVLGLTAEMRAFAERFIGMENLKMEMMKETERCRLEMEKKRIQMILESQRRIVDSIGRVFGSSKRIKIGQQT
ncbi:protein bfr2-like [Abrus precatorius]|uniref:Protein bfr2-like n=1 Tax=Abrus precatorius TaxID=3816 RepID=A0A8B8K122_ABRPR|nr:protein bfr2-like [Abrus precatorius]